jgi:arylsulfatase
MSKERRPNILWYCTDQQRWDTIGALGNPHMRTPVVDTLVREGTAFTRAYTQSPICTPSRATFLTGRYPASHHVHRNGAEYFPAQEILVTRLFADAGYDCGLVGKLHLSAARAYEKRPDDGYRAFWWSHHPNPDFVRGHDYETWLRHEKKIDPRELYASPPGFCQAGVPGEYHQTTWCAEMAIRFITESRAGPWLMSVNPFDPHSPFDAPPEYLEHFDPESLPLPLFRDTDIERQKAFLAIDQQVRVAADVRLRGLGSAGIASASQSSEVGAHDAVASLAPHDYDALAVKANYYAMIELLDDGLGRILQALRATGQLDNTIVVFMSDHGELLGDHGLILKGCRFFDGLVRVPLVMSWPGHIRTGLVSDALVELVDLAPTLLEAARLPVPYRMQGRSLLPILTGAADPERHKPYVTCAYHDAIKLPGASQASMFFDGRYKMNVYHGHDIGELYDTASDPGEFDNLWGRAGARDLKLVVMKQAFDATMATSDAGVRRVDKY